MADARSLHFGIQWDDGDDPLGNVLNRTEKLKDRADEAADAVGEIGTRAVGIGAQVSSSMDQAAAAGAGIGTSIRSALTQVGTQITAFSKSVLSTGRSVTTAFTHPVQFIKTKFVGGIKEATTAIKDKLTGALQGSKKASGDAGAAAKKTGDDFAAIGSKGTGGVDQLIGGLKRLAAAAVGIAALKKAAGVIKDFMATATNAAAAAEETQSKFDVVFKDAAGGAQEWVANFASSAKRGKVEVMGFMADSQAMFTGLGMGVESAADMSQAMTSLSYDLASFHNLADEDAFAKLRSGMMGETEGLKTMGIVLNEAALRQSMLGLGIRGSFQDLDEATKAQVRFNAILAQTSDAQTDVTRTSDSYTNGLKGVKGMWADFLANAGAKFTPVLTRMFNVILDKWPVIEPLLMKVVDVLAGGLEDAVPVLLDLGMQLLPILTEGLSMVLSVVTPLIPVFMQLIRTILPPLSGLISTLATTLLPPFVQILNVLNTAVIQPLLPLFVQIIESLLPAFVAVLGLLNPLIQTLSPLLSMVAQILVPIAGIFGQFVTSLLPPIMSILDVIFNAIILPLMPIIQQIAMTILPVVAHVLGLIAPILQLVAPILQAMAPVIEFIGKVLGTVVEVISKIIGWVADGIGKVIDFFSSIFGGAKQSSDATADLADNMAEVTKAGEAYTPPAYEAPPPIPTPVIPQPAPMPSIEIPPMPPPDTKGYQAQIDTTFTAVNTTSNDTYKDLTKQSDDAWLAMVTAAEDGADKIVAAFGKIKDAAGSMDGIGINVAMGSATAKLPHNARGTNDFPGGWTHINEEGGEIAYLPDGSTIIPADKSERLVSNRATSSKVFAPTYNVTIGGKASEEDKREIEELIRRVSREAYQEMADDEAVEEAYQESL